jgi:hypothetical protein
LPARKRESESWWGDPESSAASGGHVSSAYSSGPLLDSVEEDSSTGEKTDRKDGNEPESAAPAAEQGDRTEVIPRGDVKRQSTDGDISPRYRNRRPRQAVRRVKRTLRHIDPVSVLKLSLFYYACFLVVWLVFVAVAYAVLASLGLFDAIDKLGTSFVLWKDVDITLRLVEWWAFVIGLTLVVLASLVNLFLAFLYNLAADVVGGAELTFVERDL